MLQIYSSRTHNALIPHLVGSNKISIIGEQRILKFIFADLKHNNAMVKYFFRSALIDSFSSTLKY